MTNEQKYFILAATFLLVVVIAVSQLLFSTVFVTKVFPLRIMSIGLIWLANYASCFLVMKTVREKPKMFIGLFIWQFIGKLVIYVACIMFYQFYFTQHGIPFIIHFLFVYLFFSIFEVSFILIFVKKNSRKCQ